VSYFITEQSDENLVKQNWRRKSREDGGSVTILNSARSV